MKSISLIISSGFVAGVPHRSPDLSVIAPLDDLVLEPEPSNTYDPSAIKIIHKPSGQFIGYVPREQTSAIHLALAEGLIPFAIVRDKFETKWKELLFEVRVSLTLP